MKSLTFLFFAVFSAIAFAQTGVVEGVITDKDYDDEPVAFASVQLKGTTLGAQSDMEGKYKIVAPVGTYTVVVTFVGMTTVEISDVEIKDGFTTTINVPMSSSADALEDVIITVAKTRESTEVLLEEKKKAVVIKQSIGAEELSQKGVSDAEGAVTKVSGISKASGVKNVFVRGLGDRYNSTSLNGLPLPSEDPEYKNISLDFFGSDLIETVDVNKVFNANITGDNSGAGINVDLKGLTQKSALEFGLSTGANFQTLGEDWRSINGEGFFGFSDSDVPVNDLSQYSFSNDINPEDSSDPLINTGFNIAGGKRFDFENGTKLNVYGLAVFDNSYRYLEGRIQNTNSVGSIFLDQDAVKYQYGVSQIGMLNLDYSFDKNRIELISMLIHKNTQSLEEYSGIDNPEQDGDRIFNRRQQTNDNTLWVNQLLSSFSLNDFTELSVDLSFNNVNGNEPDRRDFQYLLRGGFASPDIDSAGNNQRYFSTMDENDFNAQTAVELNLNKDQDSDLLNRINAGAGYRYVQHDFSATIFTHNFGTRVPVDVNNPDAVYNQTNLSSGNFLLETGRGRASNPNVFDPFVYNGTKSVLNANADYVRSISDNFVFNVGLRFENVSQETTFNTNIANSDLNGPSEIDENFILPSLSLKYNFSEDLIARFAASKTYILPRFKETAPFRYDNPGGVATQGNPELDVSDVYNFDLAFEYYPNKGEILSVTAYYKNILDPISRTEIPSGGNTLTYLNVGETATVLGAEFELRKNLFVRELPSIEEGDETLTREEALRFGLNASFLHSVVDLEDPLAQFSEDESQLEGASPLLINADLNYNFFLNKTNINTAVVFNYFYDRVYSVGTRGFENIIEKSVPTLDFVTGVKLNDSSSLSFKVKNILNPEVILEREGISSGAGDVELSNFRRGVDASIGYSYKF